jgi:hypothetical protein
MIISYLHSTSQPPQDICLFKSSKGLSIDDMNLMDFVSRKKKKGKENKGKKKKEFLHIDPSSRVQNLN